MPGRDLGRCYAGASSPLESETSARPSWHGAAVEDGEGTGHSLVVKLPAYVIVGLNLYLDIKIELKKKVKQKLSFGEYLSFVVTH